MDLSIILINHNTRQLTGQTVESILDTVKDLTYEIVVIDNSSKEEEVFFCEHEKVRVFSGLPNQGFGHACNEAVKHAHGEYLLFLNSDTVIHESTLDQAFSYIYADDSIGMLGVRQLLPDGSLDHGCKRGFPTPMTSLWYFAGLDRVLPKSKRFGRYRQTFVPEDAVADVDCVSGAFMLLPRGVFDEVGGFDEQFFMYCEDVDLCYRIREAGYRIVYYGKVSFTHLKGRSGVSNPNILFHFYHSMRIFYDTHYRDKYSAIVTGMVHLGISAKYALAKRGLRKKEKTSD